MGKYEAAFLLPCGTSKTLGDDGWDFQSHSRISSDIVGVVTENFSFKYLESYLGIDSYENEAMKMSVIFDDNDEIEQISFQLYNDSLETFKNTLELDGCAGNVELFIPKECL